MSHRLQLLVPKELDLLVAKAAQRNRISKGEWVRRAIEQALRGELGKDRQRTDPLARLASLNGPTAEMETMIAEIESGRA